MSGHRCYVWRWSNGSWYMIRATSSEGSSTVAAKSMSPSATNMTVLREWTSMVAFREETNMCMLNVFYLTHYCSILP